MIKCIYVFEYKIFLKTASLKKFYGQGFTAYKMWPQDSVATFSLTVPLITVYAIYTGELLSIYENISSRNEVK